MWGGVCGEELATRMSSQAAGQNITLLCTALSRRGEGRKGKQPPRAAPGLRLRIPLRSLTVFNSYILMPRRPLCHSASAPSRSRLGAAERISSRRGCRLPPLRGRSPPRLPRSRAAAPALRPRPRCRPRRCGGRDALSDPGVSRGSAPHPGGRR